MRLPIGLIAAGGLLVLSLHPAAAQDADFAAEQQLRYIDLAPEPPPPALVAGEVRMKMAEARVSQDPKLRSRELAQPFSLEATPLPDVPARWRYDLEMVWRDEFRPQSLGWDRIGGLNQRTSLRFEPWQTLAFEGSLESRSRVRPDSSTDRSDRIELSLQLSPLQGSRLRLAGGLSANEDYWRNTRSERYLRLQLEQKLGPLPLTARLSPGVVQELPQWPGASLVLRQEVESTLSWTMTSDLTLSTGWNQSTVRWIGSESTMFRDYVFSRLEQRLSKDLSVRWMLGLENLAFDTGENYNGRLTAGVESLLTLSNRLRGALQIQRTADVEDGQARSRPEETLFLLTLAGDF